MRCTGVTSLGLARPIKYRSSIEYFTVDGRPPLVVKVPSPLSTHALPPAGEPPLSIQKDQWYVKPMSAFAATPPSDVGTAAAGPQTCASSSKKRYCPKPSTGAF